MVPSRLHRAEVMCGASTVGIMAPQTSLIYFQMCQKAWSLFCGRLIRFYACAETASHGNRERPPQGCWSFAYPHKSCPAGLFPLPAELITRTSPTANKPCRSPKVGTHPAVPPGTGSLSCQRVTHFSSCCQVRCKSCRAAPGLRAMALPPKSGDV